METSLARCFGIFSALILTYTVGLPKQVVPNFHDLKIKTRHTSGDQISETSELRALYLKGSRQRTEHLIEKPALAGTIDSAVIWQCDEKRSFFLNQRDKIYNSSVIEDMSQRLKKTRPVNLPEMSGAEVLITIDSVDTGERRKFGHYTARNVKVKTKFEPRPGASTPASIEKTDGWYIDLPGFGCAERSGASAGVLIRNGNQRDRLQVKWLGKAPRGYPIEETSVKTEATNTIVSKIVLLEISEAPLSHALFEPPTGYRQALQTGNGGADLTKPDTIFNRANYYWARMTFWLRSLFN